MRWKGDVETKPLAEPGLPDYLVGLMITTQAAEELSLDFIQIKKASLLYRAINHELRQQMMKLLHAHKRMTVTELYCMLRLEQSVASQHLAIMRKAGLVKTERDGKFIYYSVHSERLRELEQTATALLV